MIVDGEKKTWRSVMQKFNTYLPKRQIDFIKNMADKNELKFSETLRRILDDYIERNKNASS